MKITLDGFNYFNNPITVKEEDDLIEFSWIDDNEGIFTNNAINRDGALALYAFLAIYLNL